MSRKLKLSVSIAIGCLLLTGTIIYVSLRTTDLMTLNETQIICVRDTVSVDSFLERPEVDASKSTLFRLACLIKRFKTIKPGRYQFMPNMTHQEVIDEFRSGGLAVVDVRIDKAADLYELAGLLGELMFYDSAAFIGELLKPDMIDGFKSDSISTSCSIIPNTYEFYWNMSPPAFLERMQKEYRKRWSEERLAKAERLSMTPCEVTILASIVKAETVNRAEAPAIAGLYINRLNRSMPLQSDPTALFGRRKGAKRVYLSDLQSDNPYNTYKIKGLPPGPINFPETTYIDAVLDNERHDYLFMCAEPGATGKHRFARTLSQHEQNRKAYIGWLESQGIR